MTDLCTKEEMDNFVDNMKTILFMMDMSAAEFARHLDVSKQTICNIMHKRNPITVCQYIASLQILNYIIQTEPERIVDKEYLLKLLGDNKILKIKYV